MSKFTPDIVKLLSDPISTVRDTAFNTLVDLYKHVGEKLRADLQKRNLVPQGKWPALSARFDEVKNSGELLLTASKGVDCKFNPNLFGVCFECEFIFSRLRRRGQNVPTFRTD